MTQISTASPSIIYKDYVVLPLLGELDEENVKLWLSKAKTMKSHDLMVSTRELISFLEKDSLAVADAHQVVRGNLEEIFSSHQYRADALDAAGYDLWDFPDCGYKLDELVPHLVTHSIRNPSHRETFYLELVNYYIEYIFAILLPKIRINEALDALVLDVPNVRGKYACRWFAVEDDLTSIKGFIGKLYDNEALRNIGDFKKFSTISKLSLEDRELVASVW